MIRIVAALSIPASLAVAVYWFMHGMFASAVFGVALIILYVMPVMLAIENAVRKRPYRSVGIIYLLWVAIDLALPKQMVASPAWRIVQILGVLALGALVIENVRRGIKDMHDA